MADKKRNEELKEKFEEIYDHWLSGTRRAKQHKLLYRLIGKREAKKDVKARAAMTKAESDEKLTSKMTKAELRANQSPKEAKAMLEEKKKGMLEEKKKGMKAGGIVDRQYLKGR